MNTTVVDLKRNQVVSVFEDPITCQHFEGRARLIERQGEDAGDGLELWYVKFLDDDYRTIRTINKATAKENVRVQAA